MERSLEVGAGDRRRSGDLALGSAGVYRQSSRGDLERLSASVIREGPRLSCSRDPSTGDPRPACGAGEGSRDDGIRELGDGNRDCVSRPPRNAKIGASFDQSITSSRCFEPSITTVPLGSSGAKVTLAGICSEGVIHMNRRQPELALKVLIAQILQFLHKRYGNIRAKVHRNTGISISERD